MNQKPFTAKTASASVGVHSLVTYPPPHCLKRFPSVLSFERYGELRHKGLMEPQKVEGLKTLTPTLDLEHG